MKPVTRALRTGFTFAKELTNKMPENPNPSASLEREMETGTDEFFKNQSQTNALNSKRTFDEFQDISLVSARRSQGHYDDLQRLSISQMTALQDTQAKLNDHYFRMVEDNRARAAELAHDARVELAGARSRREWHGDLATYDQSNPVTQGTGNTITAGGVPANRIVDTAGAVAGAGVSVAAEAVAAAVAKQVDATVTPVVAVLQTLVSSIATMNASIANVIAQTQPKS